MLDYSLHSCFLVSGFMKRHRNSVMIVNLHKTRLEEKKVDDSIIQYLYLVVSLSPENVEDFKDQINKSILG